MQHFLKDVIFYFNGSKLTLEILISLNCSYNISIFLLTF